jgi:8-oxo-dGTP pyrophosphatase MutT (NUDIX family)
VAIMLDLSVESRPSWFLTMRSAGLGSHPGQYALPGGRAHAGEGPLEAAVREMEEEIGIGRDSVDGHGLLDDYVTASGFVITPVVLWSFRPLSPAAALDEVAQVYRLSTDSLRPEPSSTEFPDEDPRFVHTLRIDRHELYPPTAAILTQFRDVWLFGRVTRVQHLRAPEFAKR